MPTATTQKKDWPVKTLDPGGCITLPCSKYGRPVQVNRYVHNYAHITGKRFSCTTFETSGHKFVEVTRLS